jgi:14-3-3 protein epsilon
MKKKEKKTLDKCDYLYINGIELARQWEMNNALLLAIQCNYCVFLYEVKGEKNEAIEYLSIVLERINDVISKEGEIEFERMKGKEYMKVLNLIKQNIFIWSNDTSEYKVAQNKQEEFY